MITVEEQISAALVDVLNNASTRPRGLGYILYPPRGLNIHTLPNGDVEAALPKYGFSYKFKGIKPKTLPVVDLQYTSTVLARSLAPEFILVSINDVGRAIKIIVRRKKQC